MELNEISISGPNCEFLNPILSQANLLFQQKRYEEAVPHYQRYLEQHFDNNVEIDGLGNYDQALGYYEWWPFDWYLDGVKSNKFKGTVHDALSLCIMKLRDSDEKLGIANQWYQKRVSQHPHSYQFIFGYANVLNNEGYYDDAVEQYTIVTQMRPHFLPAYQCMSFIYEFKRNDSVKALEYARSCLSVNPGSLVGKYVVAKNQKNIDERIQRLKQFSQEFPKYSRGINMIGFTYGETKKMPQQAIIWHKKSAKVTPLFDIAYHNIGMRYEALKDYPEAIYWQIQAIRNDRNYKLPMTRLQHLFTLLNWTEQQIEEQAKKHKILLDYFYYSLGIVYYDAEKYDISLKYYFKAESMANQLKSQLHRVYNSIANTYLRQKKYEESIKAFQKAIELYPQFHMAYYNLANVYKQMKNIQEAKNCHKKAIQINPRYVYPYNNLGNIYLDEQNYDQAIKCYKKAVKHRSNYILALANLGVCYLKVQNYRQAFNAISRAKELMGVEANTKDLSAGNRVFLRNTIDQFDRQGEMWRLSGGITPEARDNIINQIKFFEQKYTNLYKKDNNHSVNVQKIMKKEIIHIIELIKKDQFGLQSIDRIFQLVRHIFQDNEEYFHIIPLLFIQYFRRSVKNNKISILQIEKELFSIIKRFQDQTSQTISKSLKEIGKNNAQNIQLNQNQKSKQSQLNVFQKAFFSDFQQLYNQIIRINEEAKKCYSEYKKVIDFVRIQSKGSLYGIGLKIPKSKEDQFNIILKMTKRIFSRELTQEKTQSIISEIEGQIEHQTKNNNDSKFLSYHQVADTVMNVWRKSISEILRDRKAVGIETTCNANDFLRARIVYSSVQSLKKALSAAKVACSKSAYQVIDIKNRLDNQNAQDIVITIKVRRTVCQLQLTMRQDETQHHLVQAIRQIDQFPLGCILGSYIYMAKDFHYPFLRNCRDIVTHLSHAENDGEKETLEAAKYIVENLGNSQSVNK